MSKTFRLDKILSNYGYGTRKEIKDHIRGGLVRVDGQAAKDPGQHVDPVASVIEIKGSILKYREFVYLMMNKPDGVISATHDDRHKTVIDLLPEEYAHFKLFPAGRLDIDTEGLLLITNDGELAHEILSPKKHVPKVYYALIDGGVQEEDITKFSEGLVLNDGYQTLPSKLDIIKSGQYSEIELTIYEGKFHQVKRMFEAVGKKVKYLKRIKMGGLELDETLSPGAFRELKDGELELLKNNFERT